MGLLSLALRAARAVALLTLAFLVSSVSNSSASAERRVALVIGNSAYRNVARLGNPANDARLMAATLKRLGFEIVGDGAQLDLDKSQFDSVLQSFSDQVQGADVGLFYYAGHGVQVAGHNFLVPVEANPTKEADVYLQMIDTQIVLSQMQGSGTRLNIVLLDACRNSPFTARGLRSAGGGLAQMQAPEGTLISYATQPGNVALDGADGDSPYTKALARTISRPGLGLFDAFNEVGLAVKRATGGAQQPWVSSSPIEGGFYFAGRPTAGADVADSEPPGSKPTSLGNTQLASREADEGGRAPFGVPPAPSAPAAAIDPCDQLAGWPFDSARPVGSSGIVYSAIDAAKAAAACRQALLQHPGDARYTFDLARALDRGGERSQSIALMRQAADAGSAAAMTNLGIAYRNGVVVDRDFAEAFRWFKKGAEAGNPLAMLRLAAAYEAGEGVAKDIAEALKWYQKSAEAGLAFGMAELGRHYADGLGLAKDPVEAARWYRTAADAGSAPGMMRLAMAYLNGVGVDRDSAEAVRWFKKAADLGDRAAMNRLARAYRDGDGVAKDQAEADLWSAKAKQ